MTIIKILQVQTTVVAVFLTKFDKMWLYHSPVHSTDADRITNSKSADQTVLLAIYSAV